MKNKILHTIEEIKQRVKNNIERINKNQKAIKEMLKYSNSAEYAGQFDIYNNETSELLTQNNDLINVQLTLVDFLEKYKDTAILKPEIPMVDIYSITDLQEVFALTIKGVLSFNEKHPYFHDMNFIDKLIGYFQSQENYEECQKLYKLKESIAG
jgi:hypothetical protein